MTTLWMVPILLAACAAPQAQNDDPRRFRDELIKARLENLGLKLQLSRLTNKPDEELKILEEALDSDLAEVVGAAFRELGTLPDDRRKAAVPTVLRRFSAARESFRIEAIGFLGRVPLPEAEATVLRSAADGSAAVRKAVANALKTGSGPDPIETLLLLFRDPDPSVRLAALDALGVAKHEPAVAPLAGALSTEKDPTIVEKMVDALGTIGSPAATDALLELLSKTPKATIRWSCINSLGKIGDTKAGPRLLPFMEPPQPMDVRLVTIESLGKLKETAALPKLAELLTRAPEENLRQAAAGAFALMAGAGAITETLLPAYLAEASEPVGRSIWTAMLALSGDAFVANERLALAFLAAGRRNEADQICTRLHGSKPEGDLRLRRLALEEAVARSLYDAGDFKAALPHYKQQPDLAPDRLDAVRRVAACQRELKDYDGVLKTLADLKDPEPLIEEVASQLQSLPADDRRKLLDASLRSATEHLIEGLSGKEDARKTALDAIRRVGRKILPALIADLEEAPKNAALTLEAGAVVTGIPNDPATNGDLKAKAAAWRAWLAEK